MKKLPITDTSPEAAKLLEEMYVKRTGPERLMMALNMYDTARALVIASLPKDISEKELRKQLFLRFYKDDFTEEQVREILSFF